MSASRMYENDIPEQVIKEINGHHSECVRMYKYTPDSIKERASMTINGQNVVKSDQNIVKKWLIIKWVEDCEPKSKCKHDSDDESMVGNELKKRLDKSLSVCNIIKNVIKMRLEMRKKQGDK